MKRLFVGVLLALLLVQSAAAGGGIIWFGVSSGSHIVDAGADVPTTVTAGEQFTVEAWMTTRSIAYASTAYVSDAEYPVPVMILANATTQSAVTVTETGIGSVTKDAVRNVTAAKTGVNIAVSADASGLTTLHVTYTGTAAGKRIGGTVSGTSRAQAISLALTSYWMAWLRSSSTDEFSFSWSIKVRAAPQRRTSLPVSEHVVVMGLPLDTRWCTLERLELDGMWTWVPPMQPGNQIDAAHIDLMVHGTEGCWYRMTPNTGQPLDFFVPNTGSTVTTVVRY